VIEYPMKTALGITPRGEPQIRRGALCGACHTVVLPVLDKDRDGRSGGGYEQATYIEWLNSVYQNEIAPFDAGSARTCQSCHMPQDFRGNRLRYRVAIIEDPTYPMADHRARDSAITVAVRDTFSRHMLMGINLFTLAMFQQFPDTLGIRSTDYMYSAGVQPLVNAGLSAQTLAREQSARVTVERVRRTGDSLEVAVRVENLAGHRLPSGVGFRRAFLELAVVARARHALGERPHQRAGGDPARHLEPGAADGVRHAPGRRSAPTSRTTRRSRATTRCRSTRSGCWTRRGG
jgi:hypothetical protein